jgi:hypothetical protein
MRDDLHPHHPDDRREGGEPLCRSRPRNRDGHRRLL